MPEMIAYKKECHKRCEWCAKGVRVRTIVNSPPSANVIDQMHEIHPVTGLSEFILCQAPTLAQFSEEQAARIESLVVEVARLQSCEVGMEPLVEEIRRLTEENQRICEERDAMKKAPYSACWQELVSLAYLAKDPPMLIWRIAEEYNRMQSELSILRAGVEAVESLTIDVIPSSEFWDGVARGKNYAREAMRSAMETQMTKGQNAAT